jgi:hypothetical protein
VKFATECVVSSIALLALAGCRLSTYYSGDYYYDEDGYDYCHSNGTSASRDIATELTERQERKIAEVAQKFAHRFGISEEQSLKLAYTSFDLEILQDRSADDLADFSRRLYGVNPSDITVAVGRAQLGDSSRGPGH